ncbi:hypothetical protein [Amycolatopsis xylanica]|uniref:hypothetical protein n=1 Tax=Amycolatopsis xylanica TaxID=589385 RepID=UPI000B828EA7|nr:hypothetical protein [Amycolatopsis xylanica]
METEVHGAVSGGSGITNSSPALDLNRPFVYFGANDGAGVGNVWRPGEEWRHSWVAFSPDGRTRSREGVRHRERRDLDGGH